MPSENVPEDVARMCAGMVHCAEGCGVVMNEHSRVKFGFEAEDYLYIASEDRGTLICRQLRDLPLRTPTTNDYIYMDEGSLNLLNVDLHNCLRVWKSDIALEVP